MAFWLQRVDSEIPLSFSWAVKGRARKAGTWSPEVQSFSGRQGRAGGARGVRDAQLGGGRVEVGRVPRGTALNIKTLSKWWLLAIFIILGGGWAV